MALHHKKSGSIRTLFLLCVALLIVVLSAPLLISGMKLMEGVLLDMGTEILKEKLASLIAPVDLRYEKLQRVGLEDSTRHRNEIKEKALADFREYRYKNSGRVFVIGRQGDIILSSNLSNTVSPDFQTFMTGLTNSSSGILEYETRGIRHYSTFTYYPNWHSYVGLDIQRDELFSPYYLFLKINMLVLAGALVFAIFFVYLLQKLIINPIISLTSYATSIADGLEQPELEVRFMFELGMLKEDFMSMVAALKNKVTETAQQLEIIQDREKKLGAALSELQESEERYREIFDAPSDAIFIHDASNGAIVDVNIATTKMYGFSHDECLQLAVADFSANEPPYTQEDAEKKIGAAYEYGPQLFEWRAKKKDGTLFWVEVSLRFISIRSLPYVIAVVRDIDARKNAEDALAAETERLAVTLRSIGDGVITTDMSGKIVLINKVAEELTGWPQQEAAGRLLPDVLRIINGKDETICPNPVEETLNSGVTTELARQTVLISRHGSRCSIADSCAPIRDQQNNILGAVLVFRDVTEKLRTEEELLKIKKLESVGILAAGIAHDFNNILAAILGNLDLVRIKLGAESSVSDLIEEAEKASLRARGLTQQLLTFSRGGAPVRETSSIAEIIRESSAFVLRGSSIVCTYDIPDNLWLVNIDEGQISQVVQNLIINARQATVGSGVITITCSNVQAPPGTGEQERYVSIAISDTGSGIPDVVIDKIFDPYFTTKEEGNGLGLAVCHSVVSKHDGRIEVSSTPGKGTTFTIFLPATSQSSEKRIVVLQEGKVHSKARVLVMDDESMIRALVERMLNQFGHECVVTEDGSQAIPAYQQAMSEGRPFDIVMMDLTIPGGIGGKEAIVEILRIDPQAKVIVSSGYANDPVMANYEQYGFSGVIAKPFTMDELSKRIEKVLVKSINSEKSRHAVVSE